MTTKVVGAFLFGTSFSKKFFFHNFKNTIVMAVENLVENYLERLINIENNTNNFQRKVVFPNNSISLMFVIEGNIFEIRNEEKLPLPFSAICGQLTKMKEFMLAPGSKIILIKFKPWAATFFFEYKFHRIINQIIPLKYFTNRHPDLPFQDKFFSISKRKENILDFLAQHFRDIAIDKAILQAIHLIYERQGQIKVNDLARKVFMSKRSFERKFEISTGLTPKQFIINSRFQNGLHFLYEKKKLREIACNCGYSDQSHFSNNIKKITSLTATEITPQLCRIFSIKSVVMSSSLQFTRL